MGDYEEGYPLILVDESVFVGGGRYRMWYDVSEIDKWRDPITGKYHTQEALPEPNPELEQALYNQTHDVRYRNSFIWKLANRVLLRLETPDPFLASHIWNVQERILRSPKLTHDMTLYRSAELKDLRVGDKITFHLFVSTSSDMETARMYLDEGFYVFRIRVPKGSHAAYQAEESQYLLPYGTKGVVDFIGELDIISPLYGPELTRVCDISITE